MMENQSRAEKLEFWSLVVEEFENSDKSIKEQCEHNDIPLGQYYNWRKKVREPEQSSPASFVELEASDTQEEQSWKLAFIWSTVKILRSVYQKTLTQLY